MNFKHFTQRINHHYSGRLALRPIALSDAWPLFEATQADGFNEHLLWQRPDHHLPVFERIESIISQSEAGKIAAIAAVARKTGQFAALYRFAPFANGVEMSLWTHPAFWGRGFGTETTQLAVQAAMAESNANKLYARSMNENKPAQRVLEKVGLQATDIGSIRDETGRERHYLTYSIDRRDWVKTGAHMSIATIETSSRLNGLQIPEQHPANWETQENLEMPLRSSWATEAVTVKPTSSVTAQ